MNSLRLDAGMRMEPNILGGGTGGTTTTKDRKTVRLELELFQTNSNRYPEFNYSKLVHLEKKKQKLLKQKQNCVDDGFEDHDEVARIAKELEKKYGASYGRSRGRNKKDEPSDIGKGYDESDSFIDNTEAYDEVVPEEVEPIEGGFYINCGALEFKNLHQESMTTKTDEIIKMPNRSKRQLLSSSEESSSSDDEEDDDDEEDEEDDSENEIDSKSNNDPSEKRSKSSLSKGDAKKAQETEQKKDKSILISGSSSNSPKPMQDEIGSDSDKDRARQKSVKTTTVKDMLKAKRDSFLKSQVGTSCSGIGIESKSVNGEIKMISSSKAEADSSTEDSENSSESSESEDQDPEQEQKTKKPTTIITTTTTTTTTTSTTNDDNAEKLRSTDTTLPALDVEVTTSITQFKDVVKSRNMLGKKFQFDESLTEVFLKIDEALLCLDKPQRNMVFAHLEYHLLLPKYYFLRKAKQLRIKEEKLKGQRALMKLRRAVIEAMPGVIACYETEMRKFRELQAANMSGDHPMKEPKKKFPWNSALRNLLYEVYQVRWTSFPVLGTRKETLEEFLIGYMRDKVVEIWPNGWMRYEELQREIEKRKNSSKKDKKKNNLEGMCMPNPAVGAVNTHSTSSSVPVSISIESANFVRQQFEEQQLQTNFDAASMAPQMKRKASESNRQKNKVAKTYGEQQQQQKQIYFSSTSTNQDYNSPLITAAGNPLNPMDVYSQSKKTDTTLQSVTSSMSPSTSFSPIQQQQQPNPQAQLQTQAQPQPQSKHSSASVPKAAHVIDLDKYRSTSDILQTSKQLLNAAAVAGLKGSDKRGAALKLTPEPKQYDSSSESDCVEIVDVFPAKPSSSTMGKPKSRKQQNANPTSYHNTVPNSFPMDHQGAAIYTSSGMMPTSAAMSLLKNPVNVQGATGSANSNNNNNNNSSSNNNNNNINNSSKRTTNGPKMQNFEMAKSLQEYEDVSPFKNMNLSLND